MSNISPALELKDIYAGYGETEILHGINLSVNIGEIVAIIGPNGAGKSTAIKAVLGLSLIHISEPTRRRGMGGCRGGV